VASTILSLGLFGAAFFSDEAMEFKPKNGRFTIMFPAAKKSGDRQQIIDLPTGQAPSPATGRRMTRRGAAQRGTKMPIESHFALLVDDSRYTAGSAGVPAALIKEIPLDKRFDLFSESFAKGFEGKITDETQIKQGSIPGKRYQIEKSSGAGAVRLDLYLYVGWVMFACVEGKTKEALETKEAKAFFDSFKLTPPEKSGDDKQKSDKKDTDKSSKGST
jgi:hypothetical protein